MSLLSLLAAVPHEPAVKCFTAQTWHGSTVQCAVLCCRLHHAAFTNGELVGLIVSNVCFACFACVAR